MRSGFEENSVQLVQSPLVPPYPGPYTIPVLVDDVKQLRDFNMTRGSFFAIDASGMGDDWVAILRQAEVPFMILGLTNVLHRPDVENLLFDTAASIEWKAWLSNLSLSGCPTSCLTRILVIIQPATSQSSWNEGRSGALVLDCFKWRSPFCRK